MDGPQQSSNYLHVLWLQQAPRDVIVMRHYARFSPHISPSDLSVVSNCAISVSKTAITSGRSLSAKMAGTRIGTAFASVAAKDLNSISID